MVLERDRFYHLEHYEYGEAFTGSYKDRCYRIAREPLVNVRFKSPEEKTAGTLKAWVWKGPFAFRETPDEEKESAEFPYSEEGLDEAVNWVDARCENAEDLRLIF